MSTDANAFPPEEKYSWLPFGFENPLDCSRYDDIMDCDDEKASIEYLEDCSIFEEELSCTARRYRSKPTSWKQLFPKVNENGHS